MRRLSITKGAVLAMIVASFLIITGLGVWYLRDVTPPRPRARSAPTSSMFIATAPPTALPTPTASPLPTAKPTSTAKPAIASKPTPTAVRAPHMVLSTYFINETNCDGTFSPVSTITVTNNGGGTLTWKVSSATIFLTTGGGSLAAGKSHAVTMYWDSSFYGAGPFPPLGGNFVNFTSNGGNAQVYVGCSGASTPVGTYTPPAG